MKFSVVVLSLVSLIPAVLGLTINTPTGVVQCQPILLAWNGGQPPYYLTLIPAQQVSATPLKTFPTTSATSLTWTVDLQANTNFNLALKDSTGAIAYSDVVTIQASPTSDNSCLNSTSSDVSSPSGTSGSSPSSTVSSKPSSSGGSGTSTKTSSTSTASGGSNASGGVTGLSFSNFGVAGVVGALVALF